MKLLLVNHEYPPIGGGASTATYEIGQNLAALGHEVTILTSGYGNLPSSVSDGPVIVRRVKSIRRKLDRSNILEMSTFLLTAFYQLPFLMRAYRPDGLIAFFCLPSGAIGLAANLFTKIPYILSLRGGDVPGLVPELHLIHKSLAPLRRSILKHARAVVANSEGLRRLSQATDNFAVKLVPNGVDALFFRPNKKPKSDRLRVLFVGRFQKQKNVATLLTQLATLPPDTFELHLVGDGPLRKELELLAKRLGLEKHILWHGWLPRTALVEIYQSVDCFVNPSQYEGLPNTVLEAMACGLPVIASDIPGNNELVVDGETGFLIDLNNPTALRDALVELQNFDCRSKLGQRGRDRVVSKFSWRAVADSYAHLMSG